MPIELKPPSVIKVRLGIQPKGPAHKFFTNTCYNYMDRYVPYSGDTGRIHLREAVAMQPDAIIYTMPYARYIYYGKKMVMSNGKSAYYSPDYGFWSKKNEKKTLTNEDLVYHTAGTGPYWDQLMWSAEKESVIAEVQKYVDTHGGK